MRGSSPTAVVLPFALCAAAGLPQGEPEAARMERDPDRGLSEALRAKLRLADAALDGEWPTEVWAARVAPALDALCAAFAGADPVAALAEARWIPARLRVAELVPAELESLHAHGAWTVARGKPQDERERELPAALAAWRARFGAGARLSIEVHAVETAADAAVTHLRLSARGPGDGGGLQHDAQWTCRWTRTDEGVELAQLSLGRFESAALAGRPAGLFEDATAALLAHAPEAARQLGAGLDEWRRTIPASLEPGTLGHHGLALGDADGDGLEDLYLCQPGGLPNRLLLRAPDGSVRDVSAAAGVDLLDYSASALLADFDGDANRDLVVSTAAGLLFFEQVGPARFERRSLRERSLATSLAAADFDADGDLDLYACSYLSPYEHGDLPLPYHLAENGPPNQLLRNDGAWNFVDATAELGLSENDTRFSFAAAWEDFDADGDLDLYVANDFGRNNLYRQQDGRFRDVARELGVEDVSAGMGVSWGDADGDGWMDLYVTNMHTPAALRLTGAHDFRPGSTAATRAAFRDHAMGNSLLVNRGGRAFEDRAEASGTGPGRWGWGAIFVDFDNDGASDLFAPNGFVSGERADDLDSFFWRQVVLRSPDEAGGASEEYALGWRAVNRLVRQGWSWNGRERNLAWLNLGGGSFADVSGPSGLDLPDDARAAARVDWDRDGDLDLLVTNRTAPGLRLLLNRHDGARDWIAFELDSGDPRRTAVGARVTVTTSSGRVLVESLRCGEGFLAQSTSCLHFGLGGESVASASVCWPDGAREDFGAPAAGARWRLVRGAGEARAIDGVGVAKTLAAGALAAPAKARSTRTLLPAPLPMTRLVFETTDARPAAILGITMEGARGTGEPLALVVWDSAFGAGLSTFEALAAAADELRAARVQVLAVIADAGEARAQALASLRAIPWPFSAGFAPDETLLALEQVQGALHESHASLLAPACFLISPGGELLAAYTGRVEARTLIADLALAQATGAARRDAAAPFAGTWIAAPPGGIEETLAARLAAHGLERAAAEYRLARVQTAQLSGAEFQVELAAVRERQGQLDEAERLLRAALAADPRHARAARGLAALLQRQGRREQAVEVWRAALALEPGDGTARANLGALLFELGDLAGAQSELETLQAQGSEHAPALEELLRARREQR